MGDIKFNEAGETTRVHWPETSKEVGYPWRVFNNNVGDYLFFTNFASALWETMKQIIGR